MLVVISPILQQKNLLSFSPKSQLKKFRNFTVIINESYRSQQPQAPLTAKGSWHC